MSKKRIYEAARELDLSSKALLQLLKQLGFDVKSHMSVFTDEMAARVQQRLSEEKEEAKKEERKKEEVQKAVATKAPERVFVRRPRPRRKRRKKKHIGRDYAAEVRRLEEERRRRREELLKSITKEKVFEAVRQTLAQLSQTRKKRKYRKSRREEVEGELKDPNAIEVHEFMTTKELAERLGISPTELIEKCFKELGLIVTINQRLDFETISLIADAYGKKPVKVDIEDELAEELREEEEEEDETKLVRRPPVVTVMGHVDHGKTTLLDYIRKTNVVAGEVGGITQHIGAYMVETEYGEITFIDTPGHKAFTAMRARGAQVTDIAVLVVDWKDGVMPQTVEAINHARASGVPIIVAINKMDLPGANSEQVMKQLSELDIVCDQWGGDTLCVEISAKTGMGVDTLIEYIILQAELMELKANPFKPARGVVLEAWLDSGRGPTATVLIQQGTLYRGDPIVVGMYHGRVRNMFDERGNVVEEAGPSRPVQVIGLNGVPEVGDLLVVVESEKKAAEIASKRRRIREAQREQRMPTITLATFYQRAQKQKEKTLRLILKGDVGGSVEAISDLLSQLSTDETKIEIIHRGVGNITENDVLLAAASKAVIIGFSVKADSRVRKLAEKNGVEIRLYRVIYDLEDDIKKALEGMLEPEIREEFLGKARILKVFRNNIAGCLVEQGVLRRDASIRIYRDDELLGEGKIADLRRYKDQVKEVVAGLECGVMVEGVTGFQPDDIIEAFKKIEIKKTL